MLNLNILELVLWVHVSGMSQVTYPALSPIFFRKIECFIFVPTILLKRIGLVARIASKGPLGNKYLVIWCGRGYGLLVLAPGAYLNTNLRLEL